MTVPSVNSPTTALATGGKVIAASSAMFWALIVRRYTNAARPMVSWVSDICKQQKHSSFMTVTN